MPPAKPTISPWMTVAPSLDHVIANEKVDVEKPARIKRLETVAGSLMTFVHCHQDRHAVLAITRPVASMFSANVSGARTRFKRDS